MKKSTLDQLVLKLSKQDKPAWFITKDDDKKNIINNIFNLNMAQYGFALNADQMK